MSRNRIDFRGIPMVVLALTHAILLSGYTVPLYAGAKAESNYSHTVSASGLEKIDVETVNGSISIKGHDSEQINIEAEIKVDGKKGDVCSEILETVEITVQDRSVSRYLSNAVVDPKLIQLERFLFLVTATIIWNACRPN